MKNSMIIKHDSGNSEHFICPCVNCNVIDIEAAIPVFYSYGHAIAEGWVATKDPMYSETEDPVFVCPGCYQEGKGDDLPDINEYGRGFDVDVGKQTTFEKYTKEL